MGRPIDYSIVGEEFGYLKVLKLSSYRREKSRETYWDCFCSLCNQTSPIERNNLLSGNTNSCGCRRGKGNKVAELAEVSKSTVSAVINNKWRVLISEETANKVKAAAQKIGYEPYYARRF